LFVSENWPSWYALSLWGSSQASVPGANVP
jgi:hypothetical protein